MFLNSDVKVSLVTSSPREPSADEIPIILRENHDTAFGGHAGFQRTYRRIKSQYRWKNFKEEIRAYVEACPSCQENKILRHGKTRMPMEITTTATRPFQRIVIDILGPLTITETGNRFVLVIQDDLTKFSQAYALPNHEAETVARTLVDRFICVFGMFSEVLSDNGTEFNSKLIAEVAKLFKIKHVNTSFYHPQTNGQIERGNATLAEYLRQFIDKDQTNWDKWLDTATLSYNTSEHSTTKYSPYQLIFGKKPDLPSSITKPPEFKYYYDDYVTELAQRLRKSFEIARENIVKSKEKSYKSNFYKKIYNK